MQVPLRLLSAEDMQAIHDAALRVLAETGMLVDHEKAREILAAAGAHVDHDAKMVRFPPELVEAKLKLVPRETVYHGRTPEFDFTLSAAGPIYSRVAGGATHYYDLETGRNRRGTLADWRQFCTLVDALPQIHSVATMHCGDVPAATADLHSLLTLYECQRKVIVHNAFSFANARRMIEMALVLRGSREAVAERPPYRHMLSPISPLFLNEDDTAQLLLCCEYGIPTDIPIMPTAATTSPITLAGTLMQSLAEYLGTMTLAQCARPGHNMPFFVDPGRGRPAHQHPAVRRARGGPAVRRDLPDGRRVLRAGPGSDRVGQRRLHPRPDPLPKSAEHDLPGDGRRQAGNRRGVGGVELCARPRATGARQRDHGHRQAVGKGVRRQRGHAGS